MENANVSEELTQWEQLHIQHTVSSTPPEDEEDFVMIRDDNSSDENSVFPPSNHEELPVTVPQDNQNFQEPPPPQRPRPSREGVGRWWGCLGMLMNSWMVQVACKVRNFAVSAAGLGWVVAAAAAGLTVVVLYGGVKRWQRRRWMVGRQDIEDRWMVLSREKDQKISQLLLQLAQINEILSARQRVPVLRVS